MTQTPERTPVFVHIYGRVSRDQNDSGNVATISGDVAATLHRTQEDADNLRRETRGIVIATTVDKLAQIFPASKRGRRSHAGDVTVLSSDSLARELSPLLPQKLVDVIAVVNLIEHKTKESVAYEVLGDDDPWLSQINRVLNVTF